MCTALFQQAKTSKVINNVQDKQYTQSSVKLVLEFTLPWRTGNYNEPRRNPALISHPTFTAAVTFKQTSHAVGPMLALRYKAESSSQ